MRFTPIGITLGLIVFASVVVALYFLLIENRGGMAIGVVIGISFGTLASLMLYLEQRIVVKIKTSKKRIWIVEFALVIPLLYFLYEALMTLGK